MLHGELFGQTCRLAGQITNLAGRLFTCFLLFQFHITNPYDQARFFEPDRLVNCTLKPSPQTSNTQGLMDVAIGIVEQEKIQVNRVRFVDHDCVARRAALHE